MFFLTDFAKRQFNPGFAGTYIPYLTPEEFTNQLMVGLGKYLSIEKPGYADFCKHLFVRNFTWAKMGVARITPENAHLLKTEYVARRPEELPVLTRHFRNEDVEGKVCSWLDLILYSREQLEKETEKNIPEDAEWGIVAILSASSPEEAPMPPITMMRNALGVAEGGSGHSLDREAYMKSVKYWSEWATVKGV